MHKCDLCVRDLHCKGPAQDFQNFRADMPQNHHTSKIVYQVSYPQFDIDLYLSGAMWYYSTGTKLFQTHQQAMDFVSRSVIKNGRTIKEAGEGTITPVEVE